MKKIRLTEASAGPGDSARAFNVNIERITAWGPCSTRGALARVLLDGEWYAVRESEEEIASLIAQGRALDFS